MFFKSKNKSLNTEDKNKQSILESLQIAKQKHESLKKYKSNSKNKNSKINQNQSPKNNTQNIQSIKD
jgi:adenylate kinase family enzyme